jgi:hypothetical protein
MVNEERTACPQVKTWQQSAAVRLSFAATVAAVVRAGGGPMALLAGMWPFCLFNMAGGALKVRV